MAARATYVALKKSQIRPAIFLGLNSPYQPRLSCCYAGCMCRLSSFVWASHERKMIYFEVPKAASSSVKAAFNIRMTPAIQAAVLVAHMKDKGRGRWIREKAGLETSVAKEIDEAWEKSDAKEVPVKGSDFCSLLMSPDEAVATYPDYTTFTVVRDPVARCVSAYKMFCRSQSMFRSGQGVLTFRRIPWNMSFSDFIYSLETRPNHHFALQSAFLPSDTTKVDYFLRTENLREDIDELAKKTGNKVGVGYLNATSREVILNTEERKFLMKFYGKDYDRMKWYSPIHNWGDE